MQEDNITYLEWKWNDLIKAVLLFAGCLFSLPMILGTNYSRVGLVIFALLIFIQLFESRGVIKATRDTHFKTFVTAMLLFVYCALNCMLLNSDRLRAGLQTVVLLMVIVFGFFMMFKDKVVETLFIRLLYYAMFLMVASYVVSVILMLAGGWESIYITSFDYGYFRDTEIYFPFTLTYGDMPFNGIIFKRLLGFARECGLMQVFYVWGFFMADKYFEKVGIARAFMVVGILACMSTTGFIVFGVSLVLYLDIRKLLSRRTLIIIVLVVVAIYFLFYASGTRITDRASATIDDRTLGIELGLSVFSEKPLFGGGFYSTLGNSSVQAGVCAIASLGQVGLVGFSLWLLNFAFGFIDSANRKRFIYSNAALFITALFSQPIMFAPVMYWFLFTDYDDTQIRLCSRIKIRFMIGR